MTMPAAELVSRISR